MFDFRYHALSLMAVFIALAVGLLLGVAIGDEELVSSAKDDIRDSLRGDVRQANSERDEAREALGRQSEFVEEAYPILTGARLQGRSIGVVLLGDDSPDTVREVRAAVEAAGADVALVAVLDRRVDRTELAARARGTRYARLASGDEDTELLQAFGRRVGVQIVEGGQLIDQVRSSLMGSQSGAFGRLDGVVVMRSEPEEPEEPTPANERARDDAAALQEGVADGIGDAALSAVGVERRDAEESQIGWYRDQGLSSVDNLDETAGRTALVYVLESGAEGAFGRRDSAQALLPPVVTPARAGAREP